MSFYNLLLILNNQIELFFRHLQVLVHLADKQVLIHGLRDVLVGRADAFNLLECALGIAVHHLQLSSLVFDILVVAVLENCLADQGLQLDVEHFVLSFELRHNVLN